MGQFTRDDKQIVKRFADNNWRYAPSEGNTRPGLQDEVCICAVSVAAKVRQSSEKTGAFEAAEKLGGIVGYGSTNKELR